MIPPASQERNRGTQFVLGGSLPLSTLDYPGALAAVLFCQGCPWRCPYCHNAVLRDDAGEGDEDFAVFLSWLETRQGLLDAVVFSGGEPTGQSGLGMAMAAVRALGFRVGLHTAGMFPEALSSVLPHCDWVGLDIKAPRAAYDRIVGISGSARPAFASLETLRGSGVAFEIRTTWHPSLLDASDMLLLAAQLFEQGARSWVIQLFQPKGCIDTALIASGPAIFPLPLLKQLQQTVPGLSISLRA